MKRRVLIFATTYFPLVGGAEVALKELTDRLPDWEFDLVCARLRRDLSTRERIGNITVHRCGFGSRWDKYVLPLWGTIAARRIFSRAQPPALVWSLMASYGGFTALVYSWMRPRSKMLLTLQEGDPLEHYAKRTGRFSFLHRKIFVRADAVQAISRFLAEWATRMGFHGAPVVIPNGVDLKKFQQPLAPERRTEIRHSFGFETGDVVLVTTSRLSLKNGIDDLIRCLTFLPDSYKVLIVGEGEDREKLESLVGELRLEQRVVFAGKRVHDDLPALVKASDIFIRPSLSEGLGNSFLEAMAAEVPIIGTPVGGIPDFLTDGETGVFCRVRDPESIARAVERLSLDAVLREKIVRQAFDLVEARYQWTAIAEEMNDLMEKTANH